MPVTISGAIDCDTHPAVSTIETLLPYMSQHWQADFVARGIDGFDLASFLPNAPLNCRPDRKPQAGLPGGDYELYKAQCLDGFDARFAICNVLYGGQLAVSENMGAAMCSAVNDWIRQEWLDRDPRLRASIVVPAQAPHLAVEEIERCAADRRFVQIMLPVAVELMLGRRYYWPIYEAAVKHGLPIGLHAGSMYRYAPTSSGWPSHYLQDYVSNTQSFESQLLSLITQGVFAKFPDLKVVLLESGVSWLPGFLWRAVKTWRGVRPEVPWVDRSPAEIIRNNIRLTIQPFDAPDADTVRTIVEQIGSDDMLLFSTDYPHWHFDGDDAVPAGIGQELADKIMRVNPLNTYTRLQEVVS